MSLNLYREKRKFSETPEPAPGEPAREDGHLFCIQRHDATRLHYDFRLEIDGAMASWAIPQGPSLDPSIKRLAIKVEDHPLSYARFEGNIPEGNYGAGSVMVWDLGTWFPLTDTPVAKQLERGDLKLQLNGKKLTGSFAIVRMKRRSKNDEWLLIKKKDGTESSAWRIGDHPRSVLTGRTQGDIAANREAVSTGGADPFPEIVRPMLAQLATKPPEGDGWMFEIKWDGVRALAYLSDGKLLLRSRKGDRIDSQYPELAGLSQNISAKSAILDGEIVVPDEEGRPRFGLIQPRIMARGEKAIARMAEKSPARFMAFDLLYRDGRDLRNEPLRSRKKQLAEIVEPSGNLQISIDFAGTGKQLLAAAQSQALEGIVAKRVDSRYIGARSDEWRKIKTRSEGDFLICGYAEGERDFFASLVLGEGNPEGTLVYAGNVGTGFDQMTLKALHRLMQPLRIKKSPFPRIPKIGLPVVWLRPELVCGVRYLERTDAGRLRAPVFAGLKDQLPAFVLPSGESAKLNVEGHELSLSHMSKVQFPQDRVRKRELLEYYNAVSEWLLPHLRDRPLSLLRFPNGITGKSFFQKNMRGSLPEWVRVENIPTAENSATMMPIGGAKADLLYLANLGCIDQNPWMSRVQSLDRPDFVLIDLDAHEAAFDQIVKGALLVRDLLKELNLEGFPKTTGGDGMHVYIPVEPRYTYEQTKAFAELMARLLAHRHPGIFTTPRAVAARMKGRVYFDWMQNGRGKTISAPYVVRPKLGAPVATPLLWEEVQEGLDPRQFHIRNAIDRFRDVGDLFAPVLQSRQRLEKALDLVADNEH